MLANLSLIPLNERFNEIRVTEMIKLVTIHTDLIEVVED
jgi:hypothetical protein